MSSLRWGVLLQAAVLVGCTPAPVMPKAASIYVAGEGGLRAINPLDLTTQATIPLRAAVTAMAANDARRELEVLTADGALREIDGETRRVKTWVGLGARPAALALNRDGTRAVVAAEGQLILVNLETGKVESRQRVGRDLVDLDFTPNDSKLVVVDAGARAVVWVDANQLTTVGTTALDAKPGQMVMMPFGHQIFVLCAETNRVAVLDTVSGRLLTYLPVGPQPAAMLLKPDAGELFVANRGGGTISVINTGTDEVSGTMAAGRGPAALAISGDGELLYVANADAGTVLGITTADRTVVAAVNVGQQPAALALGPLQQYLFAADQGSNDVAVLHADLTNVEHRNLITLLPAPARPYGEAALTLMGRSH